MSVPQTQSMSEPSGTVTCFSAYLTMPTPTPPGSHDLESKAVCSVPTEPQAVLKQPVSEMTCALTCLWDSEIRPQPPPGITLSFFSLLSNQCERSSSGHSGPLPLVASRMLRVNCCLFCCFPSPGHTPPQAALLTSGPLCFLCLHTWNGPCFLPHP